MRKYLLPLTIITSLYATPPCEYEQQKVCLQLYKTGLSAEINAVNTTHKRVLIQAEATLDGYHRKFENWILEPYQIVQMLKSNYTVPNQQPRIGYNTIEYKFLD